MRRKLLIWIFISTLLGSLSLVLIHMLFEPAPQRQVAEPVDLTLARMYENFLHTTRYKYQNILKDGTNYSDQEKVFIRLAQKMQTLKKNTTEYQQAQKELLQAIRENQPAFESFYEKATQMTPSQMYDAIKNFSAQQKQYDIELDGTK